MRVERVTATFGRLVALHSDVQTSEYGLDATICQIGRLADVCNLVVNRGTVSRIHAQIERRGSHFVLTNLSRNGTFVNGVRIEDETILANGDKIGLAGPEPLLLFADSDPTLAPAQPLRYDESLMLFFLQNQPLDLTPSQFRLLHHLYLCRGQICTRESCARAVWQEGYLPELETENLDKLLYSLRSRLRRIDPDAELIKIRRGAGYLLDW
jgi:DNA-binding response OmpR family regulator